jgi:SprT protein
MRVSDGTVEPIDAGRRAEVIAETCRYIDLAAQLLERPLQHIPVLFDLRGSAAGMFKAAGNRHWIRYNPWIFARHYRENLANTVPHEVAHYVVHRMCARQRVPPKPHGAEWRTLMEAFGAAPRVTFDLDLAGVPQRRQRRHLYRCGCREHRISTTRHNRAQRGDGIYCCRYCRAPLRYAGT